LQVPLDDSITYIVDVPYTISYVIRKRIQVDNLNELPKEKRPPDLMIWDGIPEEIDEWLNKVYDRKEKEPQGLTINIDEVEG